MHEIWIIIEREFRERVQTRSFVIGTLAFPVFMFAIFFLPALVGSDDAQRRLVIVDDAPEGVAAVFVQALQNTGTTVDADIGGGDAEAVMEAASQGETPYRVEVVPGPADIAALNERVLMKEIDGYVVLPSDVMATGAVQYRARNITNQAVFRDIRLAATAALQFARLGSAGVDASAIQQLMAPVEVTSARITEGGEEGGDAQSTFFVAYILAFLAYFVIAMYGHAVMRSVIQEKVTRISEILVSTMRATHLMAGKIAGVSAAALLQVAIWAIMVVVAVSQSEALQEHFGVSATAMDALALEPAIGVILILYFILGFLLYAALFAGLGAAMSSEQEAQPYQNGPHAATLRATPLPGAPHERPRGVTLHLPLAVPAHRPRRHAHATGRHSSRHRHRNPLPWPPRPQLHRPGLDRRQDLSRRDPGHRQAPVPRRARALGPRRLTPARGIGLVPRGGVPHRYRMLHRCSGRRQVGNHLSGCKESI